jgi:hypothetical protein
MGDRAMCRFQAGETEKLRISHQKSAILIPAPAARGIEMEGMVND